MTILKRLEIVIAMTVAYLIAPPAAEANDTQFIVDGLHYRVSDDQTTVWVVNPDPGKYQFPLVDGVLSIPSQVTHNSIDFEVTGITNVTHQNELVKLICPESFDFVSYVSDCPKLQSIDLGGTTRLDGMWDLAALKELTAQMESPITIQGFSNLGLEEFVTPRLVFDWLTFNNWPELRYLDLSITEYIGQKVLCDFPQLETLILPEHITYNIGDCLYHLPALKTLTMPGIVSDGVAIIDALYDCNNLTTIYCPSETPVEVKTLTNPEDFEWPTSSRQSQPLQRPTDRGDAPEAEYAYVNVGGEDIDTDGCTVYVPHGCVEVYKAHPSWSMFKNIKEYDFSSREVISPDITKPTVRVDGRSILVEGDTGFSVYDNMGRIAPQENLSAGVYVVKPDNGDAVKVVIR